MECVLQHPWDIPHDSETCPSGIVEGGKCSTNIVYPIPSAGPAAFYTTYSWYMCMIGIVLLMVYLILTLVGKGPRHQKFQRELLQNKVFHLIMVALIAMPAINSIGVLSTSQQLLAKNFKLVDKDQGKVPDDISISAVFFKNAMNINVDSHIIPGLLGACALLALGLGRQPGLWNWHWKLGLAGLIILLNVLLAFIWLAVPLKDDDGKTYQWIEKLKFVYADPPAELFGVQLAFCVVAPLVVAFCIA